MKKTLGSICAFLFFAAALAGPASAAPSGHHCFATDLIAGQHHDVGKVKVWNDRNFLYVKYHTVRKVYLDETHLHVATSLEGIPQTKTGNPIPGHFDHKTDHGRWVSQYTYRIPLESGWTSGTTLYIAAHAEVYTGCGLSETAWGAGCDFPGHNWATYFTCTVHHHDRSGDPLGRLWDMFLSALGIHAG